VVKNKVGVVVRGEMGWREEKKAEEKKKNSLVC